MKHSFQGVLTALITPFKNGAIDYASMKKLIRHQLDNGIEGFVVNGTTGESPTLKSDERKELFMFVQAEVSKQVPLIMGTGSFSTEASVELSQEAERWNADGLLVVTPYYNKPPQRGLLAHFHTIARAVTTPILLYNVPGRTVASLSLETIAELAQTKNIVGIKEATGDIKFGSEIVNACGSEFLVTSGDDGTCLDLAQCGGRGVISVISHLIPAELRALMDRVLAGDAKAVGEYSTYSELTRLLFIEANPIPVKCALQLMGLIESDELRLPLSRSQNPLRAQLQTELEKIGII